MSTTLFFLLPIGLLAVVWSLCFVGCVLNTHGLGEPSPYSDTVVDTSDLLAYWPLNDLLNPVTMAGATAKARDLSGQGRDGAFTIPPAYPSGMQAMAESRVLNPPTLARGTSIVAGDAGSTVNALPASTDFEGGIVSIPWSTQSWPPLSEFTVEAWIQPKWTVVNFISVLFSAVTDTGGFTIFVDDSGLCTITIGDGVQLTALPPSTVKLDPTFPEPTYIAVTCKGGVFSIWVNPQSETQMPGPNWTSPQTNYVAADASQIQQAFIGAGANNQMPRTQDGGTGAPLFPFQGLIQSVAVYQTALDSGTIQSHYTIGSAG
jgi:hypothetical protein